MRNKKSILIIAFILNAIVLLGQIWPEGSPPFAKIILIITLLLNLLIFFDYLRKK